MVFKRNALFQTRKNHQNAKSVKRDELMDHIFDSCIAIQTYIHAMDSQLDLYVEKARQAQNCQNKRELSFAFSNIRTAWTQKNIAQIMYENLSQIRSQIKLTSLIQTFSCDVSAMTKLCKDLNRNLNIKKVMKDYNEIMRPLETSKLQFDYFNEELLNSMDSFSQGNMGISDEEIVSLINDRIPSDALFSKENDTVSSLPDSSKKQPLNSTDALRERLNQF
ncbi:MAG: hypothetical protein Q4B90_06975 [Eubacteriales bacterium]|nr:hypothetical protein [Eubacteriales bacterium]